MKKTEEDVLRAARQLGAELDARLRGTAARVQDPVGIWYNPGTDGWRTRIGTLGPFSLEIWFDRLTGYPGRSLYAGLYSGKPTGLIGVSKKIKPVRIVTDASFEPGRSGLTKPLAKSNFNRPVLEHYDRFAYFGLYNRTPGLAAASDRAFVDRVAGFLESVASVIEGASPTDGPYRPGSGDDRKSVVTAIKRRQGQGRFRYKLVHGHKATCQITGCRAVELLDACHIRPHRGSNDNNSRNGLLLRTDVHTLFDLGLLWIETPSLQVRIADSIRREPLYRGLDGKELRTDDMPLHFPALKQHQKLVARSAK